MDKAKSIIIGGFIYAAIMAIRPLYFYGITLPLVLINNFWPALTTFIFVSLVISLFIASKTMYICIVALLVTIIILIEPVYTDLSFQYLSEYVGSSDFRIMIIIGIFSLLSAILGALITKVTE